MENRKLKKSEIAIAIVAIFIISFINIIIAQNQRKVNLKIITILCIILLVALVRRTSLSQARTDDKNNFNNWILIGDLWSPIYVI